MLDRKKKSDQQPNRFSTPGDEVHPEGAPPYGSDSLPAPSFPHYRNGFPSGAVSLGWVFGSMGSEIIERLPFGVYAADQRGVVCDANGAFLSLLGARRVEDLGRRNLGDFIVGAGDVAGRFLPEGSVRLCGRDGVERIANHSRLPSDFLQAGPYHFGVLREVTDTTERGNLQAQRLASLGGLTGRVSHDLNNLLVAILGYANLLLDGDPHGSGGAQLSQIVEAAGRARELTHQLVEYSGKAAAEVREVDLNQLVEETVRLIEISVSKKVTLEYELAPGIPPVWAYAIQIRQVVMNLVVNAAEAIGERPGRIRVLTKIKNAAPLPLPTSSEADRLVAGTYCVLEVSDTGLGMTPEMRRQIFEPFVTSKDAGRGLGLAAVADIVVSHRGAVELASEPGSGTQFRVLLPCVAKEQPEPAQPLDPGPVGQGTILVVDDEDLVRSVARVALERAGFRVLLATDGREAIDAFERHADDISAVVLDVQLPVVDSVEVFERMHSLRPSVPVVLSSGYVQRDLPLGFDGERIAGFIQKPYSPSRLVEEMRELTAD